MSSIISDKSLEGWKRAVEHCEAELKQLERREEQLRAALTTFKANLKRGVPWPQKQQPDGPATTHN